MIRRSIRLSDPFMESVHQLLAEREVEKGNIHMSPQFILPQFLIDVFHLEIIHLVRIRCEFDFISIIRSTIHLSFDSGIVSPKLGRFEEEAERGCFGDMDSLRAWV